MKKRENNKIATTFSAVAVGSYGIGGLLMYFLSLAAAAGVKDAVSEFTTIYIVFAFLWPLIIFFLVRLFINDITGVQETPNT